MKILICMITTLALLGLVHAIAQNSRDNFIMEQHQNHTINFVMEHPTRIIYQLFNGHPTLKIFI